MKKLLGLIALVTAFVLVACGGGSSSVVETVCTMERWGDEFIITVQSEEGEIISAAIEERIDIADWNEDEIEREVEWLSENEEMDCDLEGDTLVCSGIIYAEDMEGFTDLEAFIAEAEADGATCN